MKNKPKWTQDIDIILKKCNCIFMVAMSLLIVLNIVYLLKDICLFNDSCVNLLSIILNTLVATLGFYIIKASLQNDKKVKEFEFYADYNFNFLTNPEFIQVERMLESCNQEYERINSECNGSWHLDQEKRFQDFCDAVFGTKEYKYVDTPGDRHSRIDRNNLVSKKYQRIVNYLVYLESFVPLINSGQLHLEEVDDLFGYRYFIAMHNPVLQEMELFRERPYYRGCYRVYDDWMNYRKHDELGYVMPMEHYNLLNEWGKYKIEHPDAKE